MTPTAKLRFVKRDSYSRNGEFFQHPHKETILQQWWAPFRTFSDGYGYQTVEQEGGEWRDVPLEQEQA
jgi:hypothetical protein